MFWETKLHFSFLDAIITLGGIHKEGAVPSKILKVMNKPGLTMKVVASHLQKFKLFLKREQKRRNKFAIWHKEYYMRNVHRQRDLDAAFNSGRRASSNQHHLAGTTLLSIDEQEESIVFCPSQNNHNLPLNANLGQSTTLIQDCSSHFDSYTQATLDDNVLNGFMNPSYFNKNQGLSWELDNPKQFSIPFLESAGDSNSPLFNDASTVSEGLFGTFGVDLPSLDEIPREFQDLNTYWDVDRELNELQAFQDLAPT